MRRRYPEDRAVDDALTATPNMTNEETPDGEANVEPVFRARQRRQRIGQYRRRLRRRELDAKHRARTR